MTELLLQNATDAILIIDLNGKITYCNKSCSDLYKYVHGKLTGAYYAILLPPENENEFSVIRERILFNEKLEPIETSRVDKNGTRLRVSVQYSPMKDDTERMVAISCVERIMKGHSTMESRSQALLETAPDAMVIVNQFGQIVLVNFQTVKLFGYPKEELLGKNVEILIPERYLKGHEQHRSKFFKYPKARGMGAGMELFGKRKNNEQFPVEVSISPLKTDQGTFVSAAIRDITVRKRAEAKFKGLLESAPDAIVIVNQDGFIQLVNAQCVKMFGYSPHELVKKRVEILIPDRYRKNHRGHRNDFFSNAKMRPMGLGLELLGKRKSGEEFPVEISLSPLETEEGVLVSAAIRDITDRKKAEVVKQRALEMEIKNKELEQFAYVASHDLQEPLRTITSFIDLLQKKHTGDDEKTTKYFKYITDAAGRMKNLITCLLDYSRIGKSSKPEKVNCAELIKEVLVDLNRLIAESKANIKAIKLPAINGYPLELKLLFQNLISNSIKFSKKGVVPQIVIKASKISGYWKFSVQDNGIGIGTEHFDKIFAIFQRLHLRDEYEGTGIGLAHCQKIVHLHGGKLWVESKLGEGSTFYFTLAS
jgi:PAS domain S-box-containing protein